MQLKEYHKNWKEISRRVKAEAGWKCEMCGHYNSPGEGYALTVHHLDGDPGNNQRWNLIAVCQRCHLKMQAADRRRLVHNRELRMGQGFLFGGG